MNERDIALKVDEMALDRRYALSEIAQLGPEFPPQIADVAADRPQLVEHRFFNPGVHPVRVAGMRAGTKRSLGAVLPWRSARRPPHPSSATAFRSVPMPETSTSTTSPGLSHLGGSKRAPAPVGVPVEITSPGLSAAQVET